MIAENKQRDLLRRYLLGQLAEPEREALADRYFVDEELFDELLEVESELLDDYVRGALANDNRRALEEYLARTPDAAAKLAASHTLMTAAEKKAGDAVATQHVVPTAPVATPLLSALWFLQRRPAARYAFAVVLLAVIGGGIYLLLNQARLRRENRELMARETQALQEKTALADQARREREARVTAEDRVQQLCEEFCWATEKHAAIVG